jgi:LAO/AO transport system kinase
MTRGKLLSVDEYAKGVLEGDRITLARAITLIESVNPTHNLLAEQLLDRVIKEAETRNTYRIAITGAPGVGKSTFIESFGYWLTQQNKKVAVLAIDPSSALSKGSILGDKTRMEKLSTSNAAFIRPSPAGETLGGVARKTRETIALIEAAGFDFILIETVGVGQSEIAARRMCDLFMLLLLPGAGDDLQGIKRGIVEMADLLVVNKADGDRKKLAAQAVNHYQSAVHLLSAHPGGWTPEVITASALENTGIEKIWNAILRYQHQTKTSGFWVKQRQKQAHHWLYNTIQEGLNTLFFEHPEVKTLLKQLEPQIIRGEKSPFAAAKNILDAFTANPLDNTSKTTTI